jgi:type I restriction enzyme R subunit
MSEAQQEEVRRHAKGKSIDELVGGLVQATDDDTIEAKARQLSPGITELTEKHLADAEKELVREAVKPFYDPHLRDLLLAIKQANEQTIDIVSQDELLTAGYSQDALDKARTKIEDFRRFIEEHKDELLALQVFYGQATADRLRFRDLKDLAERIKRPPVGATTEELWQCYTTLESSQSTGRGGQMVTDLVSLIRHTLRPSEPLTPFAEVVRTRYAAWLAEQASLGVTFTAEQSAWLDKIAEHIATSLAIDLDDLHDGWFAQRGSLGKAHELFGDRLHLILTDMNRALAA